MAVKSSIGLDPSTILDSSEITQKGQVFVGTGAGSYSILNPGTDGQTLQVNSAKAEGVEWVTPDTILSPSSATVSAVPTFANTSGTALNDSAVLIDSSANVSGVNSLMAVSATLSGDFDAGSSTLVVQSAEHQVGIGVADPTAGLHLRASDGSAESAPLKIEEGTLLAVPESGSIESDGSALYFTNSSGVRTALGAGGGSGDVSGPASSTDNAIARFDLTSGKLLQNSSVLVDDIGNLSTSGTLVGANIPAPTAAGDLVVGSGAGTASLLPKGSDGQILSVTAGALTWQTPATGGDVSSNTSTSVANALPSFADTTAKVIQTTAATLTAAGILSIPSSTASTPTSGVFVDGSTGNGMHSYQAGILTFRANGFNLMNLTSTTGLSAINTGAFALRSSSGSAANPTYSFVGNLTTGLYSQSGLTGIATSGTAALVINTSQRVAIGSSTATASLHINKTSTGAANTAPFKIDPGTLLTTPESGAIETDGSALYWTDNTGSRKNLTAGGGGGSSDIITRTPVTSSYTATSSDYVLGVTASAALTITLPASPTTGKLYVIKDEGGNCATNNITVTSTANIDGASTFVMNNSYGSLTVYFSGTTYFVM